MPIEKSPGIAPTEDDRVVTRADQLPEDVLRVVQDFENAVTRKAEIETRHSAKGQRVLNEYTETKKTLLNFFREVYGLEQLP